jgi:hypothetical protein
MTEEKNEKKEVGILNVENASLTIAFMMVCDIDKLRSKIIGTSVFWLFLSFHLTNLAEIFTRNTISENIRVPQVSA